MKIQSVVDVITKDLRNKIIRGILLSGEKIKEIDIVKEFNTSTPPIRESFKILESEGLITLRPRRGAFVSEITQQDIWEIYTVYASLTDLAIEVAIERISLGEIKELENLVKKMEEGFCQEPEDIEKYHRFHRAFHANIMESTQNKRLMKICTSLNNQTLKFSKILFSSKEYRMASLQMHKEILEAIKSKNIDRAKKVSHEHVMEGMKNLQGMFEKSRIGEK